MPLDSQSDATLHRRWNSRRNFILSSASWLCARSLAQGQDEPTFSASVKVVNVVATVRNKKNEIVRDLTKDDFLLLENGRPQNIRYFFRESEQPLTVGLMIDTSMSQERVLESERGASFRFLDEVLNESKDKLFVMQFDMAVLLRQPLTSSRRELEKTLPYVDTPTRRDLAVQAAGGAGGGGTLLFDAIVEASNTVLKTQNGRKAMIVLSDGGENGSSATLTGAIEAAQRADTLIYSILFSDPRYPSGGVDGRGILMHLSKQTGGSFFEVSKKRSIDQIYRDIQEEIRSQYSLGFVSDRPNEISEFRGLKLSTRQKGLAVQYRERYWAKA